MMELKCDFSKAREGDRTWHFQAGWGTIRDVDENMGIGFKSDNNDCIAWFLWDGRFTCIDKLPSLYWNEIRFDIPAPPKREVRKEVEFWVLFNEEGHPVFCSDDYKTASSWHDEGRIFQHFKGSIKVEE